MVRGNRHAHRNGTHHQHHPDHARRRQHPTSSQRQSVRSHHHQHRKQGNPRKQTAGETLQRAPRKPNQQPNRRRTRNAKSRRIQSATRHPTQRRHGNHQLPETSASAYPYATEQANRRSPSAQGIGKAHPCQSGEREPIPSSPHTGASPTNSCSPNSTKPEKVTNSPSPPSAKPSPIKCKQSAPSPPTISPG